MTMTAFGLEATLTLTEGNDFYVFATLGNDIIAGLGGDDIIIGGNGVDLIDGGDGNDMAVTQITFANASFSLDSAGRLVVSNRVAGFFNFQHTLANVERVQFLTLDERSVESLMALAGGPPVGQTFTGTNGPDQLFGSAGDDVFRPLFGGDIVRGGPGTDLLELPTLLTRTGIFLATPTELALTGAVGTQTFAYTVQEVENYRFSDGQTLTFAQMVALATNTPVTPTGPSAGADTLTGGTGDDLIDALAGNDVVRGLRGQDTLIGGAGNDTLNGDAGSDRLVGGDGNDSVVGGNGFDVLFGDAGNDTLVGGFGPDQLTGGQGTDVLVGGVDITRDVFIYTSATDSATGAARDVIVNFTSGTDDIDLRGIDARAGTVANEAFLFSGSVAQAFSVWTVVTGAHLLLRGDVTGDQVADFEIRLNDVTSLSAGDILL